MSHSLIGFAIKRGPIPLDMKLSNGTGGGDYMAKKAKVTKKKVSSVRRSTAHHASHHEFFLIVAGGFVVIVLIFFMSGGFRSNGNQNMNAAESKMQVENLVEKTVTIADFSYVPAALVVKKGTTVTWMNEDTDTHSATADDGSFDTGLLQQGESGSVTFDTAGEITYHCSTHPNMTGKIIVEK